MLIADRLLEWVKRGECRIVRHAAASDLRGFRAEPSKCHDNVNRWCREHPSDKPIRGWLGTRALACAVPQGRHNLARHVSAGNVHKNSFRSPVRDGTLLVNDTSLRAALEWESAV
jgi:hypothetical protein